MYDVLHIAGKQHTTELVGRKDGNEKFTAVAFISTSNKRIKSWTGAVDSVYWNNYFLLLKTVWIIVMNWKRNIRILFTMINLSVPMFESPCGRAV